MGSGCPSAASSCSPGDPPILPDISCSTSNTFLVAKDGRVQGFVLSLVLTLPLQLCFVLGARPGLPPAAIPLCSLSPDWDGLAFPATTSCDRPSWGPGLQGLR